MRNTDSTENLRRVMLLAQTIPAWKEALVSLRYLDEGVSLAEKQRRIDEIQACLRGGYQAFFELAAPFFELEQEEVA